MLKRCVITSLIICFFSQVSFSQIPGLTFTKNKEHPDLYLKSKTIWITATPFFFVNREFSPDQGSTYLDVGIFGGNLKPYVQNDSVALHDLNSYKLIRILGLAQMGVIAPLLAYKHFTPKSVTTTGNTVTDENITSEEESGYLTAAIIVFSFGTLTYHVFSMKYLFNALERYNYLLGHNTNFEDISFNLNLRIDPVSQTPQLSLVWTF